LHNLCLRYLAFMQCYPFISEDEPTDHFMFHYYQRAIEKYCLKLRRGNRITKEADSRGLSFLNSFPRKTFIELIDSLSSYSFVAPTKVSSHLVPSLFLPLLSSFIQGRNPLISFDWEQIRYHPLTMKSPP